jgi:high-affinity iron transporter
VLLVLALLSVAFVQRARVPGRPPALAVPLEAGALAIDPAPLDDHHLHFYETTIDGRPIRVFAVQVDRDVRTCIDGCEICGDIGYFEDGSSVICRNCVSPIVKSTIGRSGGCNPIPLKSALEGGRLIVRESDLRAAIALMRNH